MSVTKLTKLHTDENYPVGWPQLAAFLNSADNYAIFRRFGTAHCRVLLHLMAEITSIEKKLDDLDISDAKDPNMVYRLRRNEWYEGWDTAQRDLLEKLRTKLSEYGKFTCYTVIPHSRPLNRNTEHRQILLWAAILECRKQEFARQG
jgi:hypothetical protein